MAAAIAVVDGVWAFLRLSEGTRPLGPAVDRFLIVGLSAFILGLSTFVAIVGLVVFNLGRCSEGQTTWDHVGPTRTAWKDRPAGDGPDGSQRSDRRGAVWTMFAAVLAPALIVGIGVVVDGGGKVEAARRADSAAYTAVRVGQEAAATSSIAQANTTGPAVRAAKAYLAGEGIPGTATVNGRTLTVTTTTTYSTKFLSVIGIGQLTAHGSSSAKIAGVYR